MMKRIAALLLTLAVALCAALPVFAAGTIEVTEDVSVSDDYDWTRFKGQVHETEEQDDVDPLHQAQMFCFHQDTPSISSSSKLDVKLMHSSTMIMSTKLMAEPTFRL